MSYPLAVTEKPTGKAKAVQWMAALFISTSLYSYGTAMMDYFLLYPTRGLVGDAEFPVYHTALAERILPVSVFPFLAITILNILLLLFKHHVLSKKLLLLSLVLLLLDWVSTIFIQIPLNLQLNERKDPVVLEYIMQTNWLRIFIETAQAVIMVMMIHQSLSLQPHKNI